MMAQAQHPFQEPHIYRQTAFMQSASGSLDRLYRYRSFAMTASLFVAAAGILVGTGWIADIRLLKTFIPGSHTIKFNTGIGFFLSGMSLRLLLAARVRGVAWKMSQVAAFLVALLGLATIAEYATGWDFGIDELILPDDDTPPDQYQGRMALLSALNLFLAGSALLLLGRDAAARWVEGLTLLAAMNALVPVIGYLYSKSALYQIPYYGTVSLSAALLFLVMCMAILAARPGRGLMSIISNESAGGITARRMLPVAIILPVAIDRLQFWGRGAGLYDSAFGMIAITLSSMTVFTLLILWNAWLLMRLDLRRSDAEDALRESLDVLESNLNALTHTNARLQAEKSVRRAVEQNLFQEHERAQVTLNSIADGVVTTDLAGRITYLNRAAERLAGWKCEEACGRPVSDIFRLFDPDSREPHPCVMESVLHSNETEAVPRSSILIRRDGSEAAVEDTWAPMHDSDGKTVGAVLVLHDISAVQAMSKRMAHIAQHDALTDLPNRFLLNDRLTQAISLALRHATRCALLFLDLDRFKHVNDTLGHHTGDRLLQEITARLKRCCVHDTDTISRHGGDEFIILLQEVSDSVDAARTAARILKAITDPYFIEGHEIHISGSIGISVCPEDGEDAETIIKHAEAAMYQAKSQGRNNYQFFTRHINERTLQRFALERNLRRAIAREESALYYQPKFSIADRRVIGAEALIRWNTHQDGMVPPTQFIPVAEESGLIIPIGEWVLRKACEQNRAWQDAGYPPIPVSVNVSAVQFREKHFLDMVARVLKETGLEPRYLELELTESVTMQDLELTVSLLESLKRMGVSLSIDDFGTGYSSLSYLKRFPIDTLKIDRSFVQDVTTDPDSAAIIGAIIGMAKSLKQQVIAEGVETREQFEFLRWQGCDGIQGYFFSQPLAPNDFERSILQKTPSPVS
jgi:diguanylate cyclase (GGDEF)-like protein/PAS domain S-box-containing protein